MKTIIEEHDVRTAVDAARERFERGEEAFEAIKWAIARDPTEWTPLDDDETFCCTLQGAQSIGLPTVTVVYVVGVEVTIKAVKFW